MMYTINSKKRIAFITGSMGKGGAERVISILANYYAAKGWEVDILMLLNDSCEYQLKEEVSLRPIFVKGKARIAQLSNWVIEIRKYIERNNPTIILSFFSKINIITILASLGLEKRIIVSERSDPKSDGRSLMVKLATQLLYPLTDRIVFQTRSAQSNFSEKIKRKSVIIKNPIEVSTEALVNKKRKLVAVGRLSEEKNHEMLIRAFSNVQKLYPEYKLYIYGEGPLRKSLELLVEKLDLSRSVYLPGKVDDIHEKISDAEIFIHPSNHEGMSNALLEAMMMGITCITTDYPGANEVIENEYNGLVVQRANDNQLAEKIIELIRLKKKRELLGDNAKNTVQELTIKNIISIWESCLELNYDK